ELRALPRARLHGADGAALLSAEDARGLGDLRPADGGAAERARRPCDRALHHQVPLERAGTRPGGRRTSGSSCWPRIAPTTRSWTSRRSAAVGSLRRTAPVLRIRWTSRSR